MKTKKTPHGLTGLATRLFNTVLLVDSGKFGAIVHVLAPRLGMVIDEQIEIEAGPGGSPNYGSAKYEVIDGIAEIPVIGALVRKSTGMDALCGLRSYEAIQEEFEDAVTNPVVQGIRLRLDSPGGECMGLFDLADTMYKARGIKPIHAFVEGNAFSAAAVLVSCADRIVLTRTSGAGSIGVIFSHVDQTAADKQAGLKYTLITAGDGKAALNPHTSLSQAAYDGVKGEVDRVYGIMTATIGRNRGRDAAWAKDLTAALYFGDDALKAGLADAIGTDADSMAALRGAIETKARGGAESKAARLDGAGVQSSTHAAAPDPKLTASEGCTCECPECQAGDCAECSDEGCTCEGCTCNQEDESEGKAVPAVPAAIAAASPVIPAAPAAATVPAAPAPSSRPAAFDPQTQTREQILIEASGITRLCAIAGFPHLAAKFLAEGLTAEAVGDRLLALRVNESGATSDSKVAEEIQSHILATDAADPNTAPKSIEDQPLIKAAMQYAAEHAARQKKK